MAKLEWRTADSHDNVIVGDSSCNSLWSSFRIPMFIKILIDFKTLSLAPCQQDNMIFHSMLGVCDEQFFIRIIILMSIRILKQLQKMLCTPTTVIVHVV